MNAAHQPPSEFIKIYHVIVNALHKYMKKRLGYHIWSRIPSSRKTSKDLSEHEREKTVY
jgi:hypothetical protein